MSEIILHHYPESPVAEKIRTVLGHKGLAYRSVKTPRIMPKPDLVALTGGYRKAPVMQVGADIFCDSALIARELERRHPEPTLFPGGSEGLSAALAFWSDRELFTAAVNVGFAYMAPHMPKEFLEDRSMFRGEGGPELTPELMKKILPRSRDQLWAHAASIDAQLSDGRTFLLGSQPGLTDFAAYHPLWFVQRGAEDEFRTLAAAMQTLTPWMNRIAAIGHGDPEKMDAAEAIEIAKAAEPDPACAPEHADPAGLKPGARVSVTPEDTGKVPVEGDLVAADARRIAISRTDERAGNVVVHFPRAGFVVKSL